MLIVAFTLNQLEEASKLLYPELVFASCVDENGNCALTCSRRDLYNHPPLGLVSRVRIVLDQNGKYSFQVLLFSEEEGTIDEYLQLCSRIELKVNISLVRVLIQSFTRILIMMLFDTTQKV